MLTRSLRLVLFLALSFGALAFFLWFSTRRAPASDESEPISLESEPTELEMVPTPPVANEREAVETPDEEVVPAARPKPRRRSAAAEKAGISIRGFVLDERGQPISGVSVLKRPPEGLARRNENRRTDARGAFEFTDVEPRAWVLEPSGTGLEVLSGSVQVVDATLGSVQGVELRIVRGECVSGRVLWPDGRPVSEFSVELQYRNGARGVTGRDGAFESCGLPVGEVAIEVRDVDSGPGDLARATVVVPQRDPLELVLQPQPLHRIGGRVLDGAGRPVPDAKVVLNTMNDRIELSVAADGSFEYGECGAGTVYLRAIQPGLWCQIIRVEVPDRSSVELVLLELASIRGIVLSPAGEPVGRARVTGGVSSGSEPAKRIRVSSGMKPNFGDPLTDAAGRFTLTCEPGRASLRALAEGYAASEFVVLELEPAANVDDVILHLRPACSLRGRVLDAYGQPVAGARVMAGYEGRVSDAQGEFTCDELASGSVRVSAHDEATGADSHVEVELRPGATNVVELHLEAPDPIGVRLQLLRDGAPLAGALELRTRGFSRQPYVTADGDELTLPKPGLWRGTLKLGAPQGLADLEQTRLFEWSLSRTPSTLVLEWNDLRVPESFDEIKRWLGSVYD